MWVYVCVGGVSVSVCVCGLHLFVRMYLLVLVHMFEGFCAEESSLF